MIKGYGFEIKTKRIIVPAITPLTADYVLDERAVEKMFELFHSFEISPFVLGTTGEASSLPIDVKRAYVKSASKNKQAGALLFAGISSNVVAESIEFAKFCADNGVDALVATLPSYYQLTEYSIRKYFEEIADKISLPLVIYNIPATTHMSIPLQLIGQLSHHPNIIATKDSERSEERLLQSLALWKDRSDFAHYLGWAAKSAEALLGGSDGLVPSTGNLFPGIYFEMLKAVKENDRQRAYEMQQLSDSCGNLYQDGRTLGESLWALKLLMNKKGLCEPVVMPPLQPQTNEEALGLIRALKQIEASVPG